MSSLFVFMTWVMVEVVLGAVVVVRPRLILGKFVGSLARTALNHIKVAELKGKRSFYVFSNIGLTARTTSIMYYRIVKGDNK